MPIGARRSALLAGATLAASLVQAPARADDLRAALLSAYATNPQLNAARENQRAVDESVPIARADGLPSLNASAQETEYVKRADAVPDQLSYSRLFSLGGTLNVPVYSGGGVRNAISGAETRVAAGRNDLRGSESSVFSQVVATYMDVILNEAVVRLNQAQVQTLDVNLQATRDRFEIGDLTRTDVAQSQSRLALARGQLQSAQANLANARERYIQFVGRPPVDLQPPPPLPGLPATADDAVAIALDRNPDLLAARERSKAARFDTRAAGAARLPKVSLFADTARTDFLGSANVNGASVAVPTTTTADVGVRATIPLYQGGRPTALVKQAQAREGAALENEIAAERAVIAQARAAWSSWQAANAIIVSSQTAVDAATLSLEGVRAENSVGNRTIIDILNAEQELVNAQLQLVTARRNAYVAGFTLLAAMGRAEARDLGLDGGPLYDPGIHYQQARGTFWDWGSDPTPRAKSTRTVDTPSQNGTINAK
ncbi:MAG: TolC family outer membrane protein [Sphingomonadales bacterium]|nr:TolC family outer membrane protein [Sphingomonadales bacterium]